MDNIIDFSYPSSWGVKINNDKAKKSRKSIEIKNILKENGKVKYQDTLTNSRGTILFQSLEFTKTRQEKITRITGTNNKKYINVQTLFNDGAVITRSFVEHLTSPKSLKLIKGFTIEPANRKFSEGLHGKIEKFLLKITNDINGYEKPILKNITRFVFLLTGRI